MIGGTQEELFGGLVIFVNRPAIRPTQLDCVGDDARQYGFDIQSRADRLADFAERFELTDRSRQRIRPLFQLLEQSNVLNGNYGLIGKRFQQCDLFLTERTDFGAPNHNDSDRDALTEQWSGKYGARLPLHSLWSGFWRKLSQSFLNIMNMDRLVI